MQTTYLVFASTVLNKTCASPEKIFCLDWNLQRMKKRY